MPSYTIMCLVMALSLVACRYMTVAYILEPRPRDDILSKVAADDDGILRVGNPVKPSSYGGNYRGSTFVLKDSVFSEGVLFAYSAYFCSQEKVRFQVWRPIGNDTDPKEYELIAETAVANKSGSDDIYIESMINEDCIWVKSGDRLGVFVEGEPGAVAYTFNPDNPSALAHILPNIADLHEIGDVVRFDALVFPYDFSVSAFIDTTKANDSGAVVAECPEGLVIPAE